jgi:hypothetical protein
MCKRSVHGAFGKAGCIGDGAHTGVDGTPFISRSLTEEVQVNNERGWLLIVSDQIPHQHIKHVIVDRNGPFETRHARTMG